MLASATAGVCTAKSAQMLGVHLDPRMLHTQNASVLTCAATAAGVTAAATHVMMRTQPT